MRVVIVGLPLFAKRLQKDLSDFDSENTYTHLDTYYSAKDKVKALIAIPRADLVYSLNGTVSNSKVFSLALRKNKPLLVHWVGSDVLRAKKDIENGEQVPEYITEATHLCEVGWIQEELQEIGIKADVMNFVSFDQSAELSEVRVDPFYVLTYITSERAEFYGINTIISLAKAIPEIQFKIAGMEHYDSEIPSNIELLGWVDNMPELISKSGVCLRYTEHDGLSSFVLETLSLGKHIIYNNDFEHCLYAEDEKVVEEEIHKLRDAYSAGKNISNELGKQFIAENFNRKHVLGALVNKFKTLVSR